MSLLCRTANEKRFYVTLTRPADSAINFEVLREALAGRERIVPQNAVSVRPCFVRLFT